MLPMARRVSYQGEVVGIQARGLERGHPPRRRVEQMAAAYLAEVRARQPVGPYHLAGYSFGGLVAFEMACQLVASGEEVGLLGLFDTLMSPMRWPAATWAALAGRGAAQATAGLLAAPLRRWPSELGKVPRRIGGGLGLLAGLWDRYGVLVPRSPGSTPARAVKQYRRRRNERKPVTTGRVRRYDGSIR
jgi:pimeloyl-ACP methyl ester carboxylesterase